MEYTSSVPPTIRMRVCSYLSSVFLNVDSTEEAEVFGFYALH